MTVAFIKRTESHEGANPIQGTASLAISALGFGGRCFAAWLENAEVTIPTGDRISQGIL
jgi:hypothetical protein